MEFVTVYKSIKIIAYTNFYADETIKTHNHKENVSPAQIQGKLINVAKTVSIVIVKKCQQNELHLVHNTTFYNVHIFIAVSVHPIHHHFQPNLILSRFC